MPYTRTKPTANRGFTIVEILIVSPMVILIVAVLVGFTVSLTGEALIARERVNVAYSAQRALDMIEQDVRISTQILSTTGTLPSPQGSNSSFTGTSAFSNTASYLILEQYATTKSPYDSSRELVYYANQPNACGATQNQNVAMRIKTIYYRDGTTLKRRVIVPSYTSGDVCATPWQRNSCKNGLNTSNQCRASDEIIAENVTSFSNVYYLLPGDTSPISPPTDLTKTALTTITVGTSITGKTISNTSVVRASITTID